MDFELLPNWSVAEAEHEGKPLIIRFREVPTNFEKTRYPKRLNIFWEMEQSIECGLPTKSEFGKLDAFEDRLIEAVETDHHSILSVVLTGNGQREFVFHTNDPEGFVQRLSEMPQEQEPYPIEIHLDEDPAWEYDQSVTPSI